MRKELKAADYEILQGMNEAIRREKALCRRTKFLEFLIWATETIVFGTLVYLLVYLLVH